MVKEGSYKSKNTFYAGADYGLDPQYGSDFMGGISEGYRPPTGQFGLTTDPRVSNQLKQVSDKLNTGIKNIEVEGLSPGEWESVPETHLAEINRLKKLAGAELTFHGPVVEPTGFDSQSRSWNEQGREQAQRQMWNAVERAHKMDPNGNIMVTFHSSNGLMDPEQKIITEVIDPNTGEKKQVERIREMWVIDKRTGRTVPVTLTANPLLGSENIPDTIEEQKKRLLDGLDKQNKQEWFSRLQHVSFNVHQGSDVIEHVLGESAEEGEKEGPAEGMSKLYKEYLSGNATPHLKELGPLGKVYEKRLTDLARGDIYLRDAYGEFQNLFNEAYEVCVKNGIKEDKAKLDSFRGEVSSKLKGMEDDPSKIGELAGELVKGVNVLRSISPPQTLQPMRTFAIDKAADTFSNIALQAYGQFRESAPIISIENPPSGSGLSRAEDLKAIVETTREKLKMKLIDEAGLSESQATKQAEKLVGATWDVGHINMIRRFGYESEDVVKETSTIAPFVKHVHLSDNFGMEHTELPMGMGNVPVKKMLSLIDQYNKQAKKIVETGGAWYRDFKVSPVRETLRAFGSPVYSMQMGPYWNQASNASGGYFAGYGQMLPEQHFNLYGAGFSNMPPELGGQMGGRSRASGAPIE